MWRVRSGCDSCLLRAEVMHRWSIVVQLKFNFRMRAYSGCAKEHDLMIMQQFTALMAYDLALYCISNEGPVSPQFE